MAPPPTTITTEPRAFSIESGPPMPPQYSTLPAVATAPSSGWRTGTFACFDDGEVCWWGTWCCCMVSARSGQSHGVEFKPFQHTCGFFLFIVLSIVIFLFHRVLFLLVLASGLLLYASYRSTKRGEIRDKLRIPGSYSDDFISHAFCSCCTVCQEAREAKMREMSQFDLCCGEPFENLSILPSRSAALRGSNGDTSLNVSMHSNPLHDEQLSMSLAGSTSDADSAAAEGFWAQVGNLSKTSTFIVTGCTLLALIGCVVLLLGRPQSILVLVLVFMQPLLILYVVYWRCFRSYASLDYTIKMFTCGFFFSTMQSVFFESFLEAVLQLATVLAMQLQDSVFEGLDPAVPAGPSAAGAYLSRFLASFLDRGHIFAFNGLMLDSHHSRHSTSSFSSHSSYNSFSSYSSDSDSSSSSSSSSGVGSLATLSAMLMQGNSTKAGGGGEPTEGDLPISPEDMQQYIVISILALVVMAYGIAAGVEETMKHFVVRCCQFPQPLKDPSEYVFGTTTSPFPKASLLVGELFVLGMRVCMPIHAICAVLQAAEYSKVVMGTARYTNTFMVLLPAVLLHGSFDFFLFLMGTLQEAYGIESAAFEVISIVMPVLMTICGAIVAYCSFKRVLGSVGMDTYNRSGGWQRAPGAESADV